MRHVCLNGIHGDGSLWKPMNKEKEKKKNGSGQYK